jgi:hypothetical protein
MKLLDVRVQGFQSFSDSGRVEFAEGVNLLVGPNNVGKSAFLRALQPNLPDDRHRNAARWENFRLPPPEVTVTLEISGSELASALLQTGHTYIPIQPGTDAKAFMADLLSKPSIRIAATIRPGESFTTHYPGHGQFKASANNLAIAVETRGGTLLYDNTASTNSDSMGHLLNNIWSRQTFYFSAERLGLGESPGVHVQRLEPNASNLPAVLHTLRGDRDAVFQKLVRHLRDVFPTVGNLNVRHVPGKGSTVEIRVWPTEEMQRPELSFELTQSGTGVAQVVAMLAAIMTIDDSVIMIDEINSFLHPAAAKLQTDYRHHQFIISTHSPDVISFSNPRTIHLFSRIGYESSIKQLHLKEVDEFREVADHLGVSMADVFASDRVIWVEGPTEELCFPLIYEYASGQPKPRGTTFASVLATGDFIAKRRDKHLVYRVYERLSSVAAPLVVGVVFSFDSEQLSDEDKNDMKRESRGAIHFLPRRHIECYLICAPAIALFISERDQSATAVSADAVAEKIAELAVSERFHLPEWKGDVSDALWLAQVDAANLIAETCVGLSEARVTFNKKDDTLALLKLVKAGRPELLSELEGYVRTIVEAANA